MEKAHLGQSCCIHKLNGEVATQRPVDTLDDSMAVLRSYYWLCAVPSRSGESQERQVGAAPDDSGGGLVTLGPHLIARYTFSDQKQIGGWASKDFITVPAIFDKNEESYVCVFNENTIKMWNASTENLDKVKKTKFSQPIIRLIENTDDGTVLVFKDGSCASLSYALLGRKNLETVSFLEKDEVIMQADVFRAGEDKYVCYITKSTDKSYCVITCQLNTDINTIVLESLKRIYVQRQNLPNARVNGISISAKADVPQVHIMWSDGRLFGIDLIKSEINLIGNVPHVNNDVDISLVWIGENHIAIYGADLAQEGAVLVVFNVLFGVVTYRYPLKMHYAGARVWCLPDNLILESHQNLAVIPYVLSSNRNVLSLIGSSKGDKVAKKVSSADWGKGKVEWNPNEQWNDLATNGVSERDICLQYFPTLLSNSNVNFIRSALEDFSDIPEDLIVNLLTYVMKKYDFKFDQAFDEMTKEFSNNIEFRELIDSLLNLPFVRETLIPYLRNNLNIEHTLVLLKYINYLLSDRTVETNVSMSFEDKLLLWSSCLIDSHFQELLLSNDKQCRSVLELFKSTTDDLIEAVGCVENVLPVLQSLNCMDLDENVNVDDMLYYIEEIKLF